MCSRSHGKVPVPFCLRTVFHFIRFLTVFRFPFTVLFPFIYRAVCVLFTLTSGKLITAAPYRGVLSAALNIGPPIESLTIAVREWFSRSIQSSAFYSTINVAYDLHRSRGYFKRLKELSSARGASRSLFSGMQRLELLPGVWVAVF